MVVFSWHAHAQTSAGELTISNMNNYEVSYLTNSFATLLDAWLLKYLKCDIL